MSLKKAAEQVRGAGRGKDTELVHFTKNEVGALKGLAKAAGGKLTRNPETGMLEAGFLDSMLPTILGFGANLIVPGSGMIVGGLAGAAQNKNDPLMGAALGAMGGYGGGQLAAGIQGAGAGAAQMTAEQAAQAAATEGMKEAAIGQGLQMAPGGASVGLGLDPTVAASMTENIVPAATNKAATDATLQFLDKPFYEQIGQGAQAAFNDPSKFIQGMGGNMPTAKAAGLAAAPMLYDYMMPKQKGDGKEKPDWAEGEGKEFDYNPGYTGGTMTGPDISSERQWYNSSYTPRMAGGGLLRYAGGGEVQMSEGGFVIPADVVSMAGNGSSSAGLEAFGSLMGAMPIDGPGDGMSDDIPASIDGRAPARVARQEAYLPPETVARMGGAKKLYSMVERVRKMAHGKTTQQRPVDLRKALA